MHLVHPKGHARLFLAIAALCACVVATSAQASSGTLGHSGRFYTVDGQATSLVGMDMQELAANPSIDYVATLDALEAHDVNAVRLWIYPYWNQNYLQPWTYGVCAVDKYDLDTWNPAYWTRLKAFVDAAQSRNIYVELSLFPANIADDVSWTSPLNRNAWNEAYNCNGEFAPNPAGSFVPQFWNTDPSSRIRIRQKQLVDKVLATFPSSSYGNVSFEIANEFPGRNTQASPSGSNSQLTNSDLPAWQNGWIDYLKSNDSGWAVSAYAQDYIGTNTNGIENYWDRPNVDILDFHANRSDADGVEEMIDDGAQTKGKIIQDNETTTNQHGASIDRATQAAWAWNANLAYFKWYWDDSSVGATDPEFLAALDRLKVIADINHAVGWAGLSDVDASGQDYDALVSLNPTDNWQVLANPGAGRYLYYGWGANLDRPLNITLADGLYLYKWINTQDGLVLASGFSTGGVAAITQPSGWNTTAGVTLTAVPANTDDCKNGAWQTFDSPVFRNEGDCVSYVATSGRH